MAEKYSFKLSSGAPILALLLIIIVSSTLILLSLRNMRFADQADEGYYFKYASYVADNGFSGFKVLFTDYLNNNEHWVYPNPLRIGFISIAAIWLKVFGYSFLNLSFLSLFSFCAFLAACFLFTNKYFSEKIAILVTALLAFSPINMAMARRALMDSTANLFLFLSIWLFFEAITSKKKYKVILFVLIYSSTILVKENSALLSLFFIFYLAARRILFKVRIRWVDFLAIALSPFILSGIVYVLASGSPDKVIDVVKIILNSPHSNRYAIMFGSGPWYRYLIDFIILSPWVFILGLGFMVSQIINKKQKEELPYLILFSVTFLFIFNFFTKNIRYLMILDLPLRLFTVLMLSELAMRISTKRYVLVLIILVSVIILLDYNNFLNLFIRHGIYDPVSCWLLKAKNIIP